jgi:hypothetical protein
MLKVFGVVKRELLKWILPSGLTIQTINGALEFVRPYRKGRRNYKYYQHVTATFIINFLCIIFFNTDSHYNQVSRYILVIFKVDIFVTINIKKYFIQNL